MPTTKADATIIAKGTANAAFTQLTGCSVTRTGTTATLTKVTHGRSNGDKVLVQGFSLVEFNGVFTVGGAAADTFTYTISADPGANPAGTPGTVDLVTLGAALNISTSYACKIFGGIQNGTTAPTVAPQVWVGEALADVEADYVWRLLTGGDSVINSWSPFAYPPQASVQFVNLAVCRNTIQPVDCFALASHVTAT